MGQVVSLIFKLFKLGIALAIAGELANITWVIMGMAGATQSRLISLKALNRSLQAGH